jgi:hypothetical protein
MVLSGQGSIEMPLGRVLSSPAAGRIPDRRGPRTAPRGAVHPDADGGVAALARTVACRVEVSQRTSREPQDGQAVAELQQVQEQARVHEPEPGPAQAHQETGGGPGGHLQDLVGKAVRMSGGRPER